MVRKKSIFIAAVLLALLSVTVSLKYLNASKSPGKEVPDVVVRGRVVSTYGPVENARVRLAGDESYTLTDREGRYELQAAHPPGARLIVTAGKEGWFNNGQIIGGSGRIPGYPSQSGFYE